MVKTVAKKQYMKTARPSRAHRKVTCSLPESVAYELDRRNEGSGRGKSRMVAEALALYFTEQDKKGLAVLYAEAARDPLFLSDNEAIRVDFAELDREADETPR